LSFSVVVGGLRSNRLCAGARPLVLCGRGQFGHRRGDSGVAFRGSVLPSDAPCGAALSSIRPVRRPARRPSWRWGRSSGWGRTMGPQADHSKSPIKGGKSDAGNAPHRKASKVRSLVDTPECDRRRSVVDPVLSKRPCERANPLRGDHEHHDHFTVETESSHRSTLSTRSRRN